MEGDPFSRFTSGFLIPAAGFFRFSLYDTARPYPPAQDGRRLYLILLSFL
jgi:hypothetical protein